MKDKYTLEINENGDKSYYRDLALHRDNGPACIWLSKYVTNISVDYFKDGIYKKGYTIKGIGTNSFIEVHPHSFAYV